jgi:hypothetical protein
MLWSARSKHRAICNIHSNIIMRQTNPLCTEAFRENSDSKKPRHYVARATINFDQTLPTHVPVTLCTARSASPPRQQLWRGASVVTRVMKYIASRLTTSSVSEHEDCRRELEFWIRNPFLLECSKLLPG